jgi:hypothetical protein
MPATPNIPMNLAVKPGGFRDRLRQINQSPKPTQAWRITVPDDLSFWYFLEFGSAGRQDAEAPIRSEHGGSYEIKPKPDHKALHTAGGRFNFRIEHPGVRPRLIYRGIRRELFEFIGTVNLAHALVTGQTEDGLSLNEAMHEVMLFAVHAMGARLDAAAPGTREEGRLGGRTAGDTFREEAQINADVITI